MDPLSELVKIDPQAVGVGQYQHDVSQKRLGEQLDFVVETAVNQVGVDVNTASQQLLQHVSGLNKTTAKNIVGFREEKGAFEKRNQLKNVPRLGPKAYEQAIGFLRIPAGKNILDNTAVHPESYHIAEKLLEFDLDKLDIEEMSRELEVGIPTLTDIVKELKKPGRDPREDMPKPILRADVLSIKDLKEGMELKGTVRNVVDFGCFVDIGIENDGLVHISELSDKYIKHPSQVVQVSDVVKVRIINIDRKRNKIGLSMKGLN